MMRLIVAMKATTIQNVNFMSISYQFNWKHVKTVVMIDIFVRKLKQEEGESKKRVKTISIS